MGILNIDEHVEEHRLMAIRYPSKAVIPGQMVVATVGIPFLIMPGDGAANGCQFTGTAGAFTLSAAIMANIGNGLNRTYAYFPASFGGSSLPAGWYWTEFSSDTAGIVYANTYTSGIPKDPSTKTAISSNLTGWITATTNEVVGLSGISLPGGSLGKNGFLEILFGLLGSTSGTKSFRAKIDSTNVVIEGPTTSPYGDSLHMISCVNSHTQKYCGRSSSSAVGSVALFTTAWATTAIVSVDTSIDQQISVSLQQSTNVACPILLRCIIKVTYGE